MSENVCVQLLVTDVRARCRLSSLARREMAVVLVVIATIEMCVKSVDCSVRQCADAGLSRVGFRPGPQPGASAPQAVP